MTSFSSAAHYQPLLVLVIGSLTFMGFLGAGIGALRLLRLELTSPWLQVVGLFLGIQIFSLLIQLIGISHLASRPLVICAWTALVILGGICNARWNRPKRPVFKKPQSFFNWMPFVIVSVSVLALLLVALAPSTKMDELYYHMLLPSRIVTDGALLFYQFPIPAAILPHMVFQISLAPLHALGFPDAGNVTSYLIGMTFLWFCYRLISSRSEIVSWSWLWVAAISVGLYPVVHYVTSGSHAMGDLAIAAAVILLAERENFYKQTNHLIALAFAFSVLCLAGATTKIAFMPLNLIMLAFAGISLLKQANSFQERKRILIWLCFPWMILILPLMIWTFWKSGSPFGPVFGEILPNSIYESADIARAFDHIKRFSRPPLLEFIKAVFISYSPLILAGAAGMFFVKEIKLRHRSTLAALALFQGFWILLILAYQFRFFAGLHYAFSVLFAMHALPKIQKWATSKIPLFLLCGFLLLPWLAGQLFYAKQFFSVSLGLEKPPKFYREKVTLYSDYQELNRILPKDAALFSPVTNGSINFVYLPRKVYTSLREVPSETKLFLLWMKSGTPWISDGYQLVNLVYENRNANVLTYRTPGHPADVGQLRVFRLQKTA